jgi:hypothetical protein
MATHVETMQRATWRARFFGQPLEIIRAHKRAYLGINLFYYALIGVGMIYAAFNPALQQELLKQVGVAFTQGPLQAVTDAYVNTQIVQATALTFLVNLFVGRFATITLPSLIIPFSGFLMGAYRALLWGLIYSPTTPDMQFILIPHALTLLLEGQAYVLALLAAFVQGKAFLKPRSVGTTSHRAGYWIGLKLTAQLYILIVAVLLIAAVYEVLEAAFILRSYTGQP